MRGVAGPNLIPLAVSPLPILRQRLHQGGARAKVQNVEILEASYEPLSSGAGFTTEARWNVTGSVGHWGHVHQRLNQYRAEITVESIDNAWRITRLEVLEEEHVDPNAPTARWRPGRQAGRVGAAVDSPAA